MKILCPDQYDADWWQMRRGRPTSSNAAKIVTPAKMQYSSQATGYIHDLIGELYDVYYPRTDGIQTSAMRNGTERENEARHWFSFETGMDVEQVGLCCDDAETLWGSPDAIVTATGEAVEIKCPTPGVHVGYLLDGGLPSTYVPQLHAHMLVTGVPSAWFISYCDGFPSLLLHVKATPYLDALRSAMVQFHAEYDQVLAKITEMHGPPPEREVAEFVEASDEVLF